MINKLRNHKFNQMGLKILAILFLSYLVFDIFTKIELFKQFPTLMIFSLINILLVMLLALFLEYKGASFAAHFITLALLVGNSINELRVLLNTSSVYPLNSLFILLKASIAIYAILKLIAHKNEFGRSSSEPNRLMQMAGAYALLGVYFNEGFNNLIVMVVIIVIVLFTSRIKNLYLVLIYLFAVSISNRTGDILVTQAMQPTTLIINLIGIAINIVFIYYMVKDYQDTPYIENNERNEYFS